MTTLKQKKAPQTDKASKLLRKEINRIKPGDKLPPERELARMFNVSRVILRRSLDTLKEEGAINVIPGKGLYKAEKKDDVDLLRDTSIVLAITGINYHNLEILNTVISEAGTLNMKVITHNNNLSIDHQKEFLCSLLADKNIKGIITNPPFSEEGLAEIAPLYSKLRDSGKHIVFINAFNVDFPINNVSFDDAGGIEMLVSYMKNLGHEKIAFITSEIDNLRNKSRLDGYINSITAFSEQPHIIRYSISNDSNGNEHIDFNADIEKAVKEDGITAFVGHNCGSAAKMIINLQEAGFSVPDDVSVAGYNKIPHISNNIALDLTSVSGNRTTLASTALNLLTSEIVLNTRKSTNFKNIVLPVSLQTGNTCARRI
ncbi:MAG: substrate-binding domain-containing protein [Planctomycetota bacterium]|jgi:DNA-binding LacI/PurR family transcriptional regulator